MIMLMFSLKIFAHNIKLGVMIFYDSVQLYNVALYLTLYDVM